jgi:hypothetical protein
MHQAVEVHVLTAQAFDHKPIIVQMGGKEEGRGGFSKSFKVEDTWMIDEEYKRIVDAVWEEEGTGSTSFARVGQKLANCQTKLTSWSSRKFGNAAKNLKLKMKKLEELQWVEGPENWEQIKELHNEIDFMLEQEDLKWKQRGKQNQYFYGDRNTNFFHAWASHRNKINFIRQTKNEEGMVWKKQRRLGLLS